MTDYSISENPDSQAILKSCPISALSSVFLLLFLKNRSNHYQIPVAGQFPENSQYNPPHSPRCPHTNDGQRYLCYLPKGIHPGLNARCVLFRINYRIFNVLINCIFSRHPAFIRMQDNQLTEKSRIIFNTTLFLIVISQNEFKQIIT